MTGYTGGAGVGSLSARIAANSQGVGVRGESFDAVRHPAARPHQHRTRTPHGVALELPDRSR